MEKICVNIYGGKSIFGGKETPERAEVISCERCTECSLYKAGKCLLVTAPLTCYRCPYGKMQEVKGYTSRAAKYSEWHRKWRNDETYGKLGSIGKTYFARIGEYYFLNLSYFSIRPKNEKDDWETQYLDYRPKEGITDKKWAVVRFGKTCNIFKKEELTVSLLNLLLSYKPYAMFGGEIKDYQQKTVPFILQAIKKTAPELFADLIKEYPEYENRIPDYKNRYAYIHTLKGGTVLKDCHGSKWTLSEDRKTLTCDSYSALLPFSGRNATVSMPVTDKMAVKIEDNDWVTEDTVFSD